MAQITRQWHTHAHRKHARFFQRARAESGHIATVGYELYCRLLEQAVRSILYFAWCSLGEHEFNEMASLLDGTWAGDVLAQMRAHYRTRLEAERAHGEANDPRCFAERRATKRERRQQQHAERMAKQRERSQTWHERHGGEHAG